MAKDKNVKLFEGVGAFHVVKMLEGMPEDLVDLFMPNDEDALAQLEMNIIKWSTRIKERAKVMQLQKHYSLPLRPNQSMRDVSIRLKILELKKNRKFKNGDDFLPGKDNNNNNDV
jgi:hypothetical protein